MLVLIGCSNKQAEWQNSNKSRIFWYEDILRCKNLSKTRLARQLDIENDANFNNKSDLQIQFEKHDAAKKITPTILTASRKKVIINFRINN